MKLNYNVTGKERKRMVAVIGEVTEIKPIYTRMPECAYVIGDIKVSKIGELIAEDEELVNRIAVALAGAGFTAEEESVSTEEVAEEPVEYAVTTEDAAVNTGSSLFSV